MTPPKDKSRPDDEKTRASDGSEPDADDAQAGREVLDKHLTNLFGEDGDGGILGGGGARSDDTPSDDTHGPRLKLDKTGALANRPKLKPRRPYARTGSDVPTGSDPAPSTTSGGPPQKAAIPPQLGSFLPPELRRDTDLPADDEVTIPGGPWLFGEEREKRELPAFRIDRTPVTNFAYDVFVRATGHRPPLYWPDGKMPEQLAEHPVVGVDYYDALAFAQWRGRDLPYEDEWERAARGPDGRVYPWGDEPELGQANTARLGHKMTLPVGWHEMNVSPNGARDMVGNVWEITHSPASGGGIVVRGGSWYDFALYAKTWFRFASRPDARNGTIGFRCVRRERERTGAAREVDPATAEAEVRARRGPDPEVDASSFTPEKRDLVPDYRRLAQVLAERAEEEGETSGPSLRAVATPHGGGRKPTKASPPPRIRPPRSAPEERPARPQAAPKGKPATAKPGAGTPGTGKPGTGKAATGKAAGGTGGERGPKAPAAAPERVHVTQPRGGKRAAPTPAMTGVGAPPTAAPGPGASTVARGEQAPTPFLYWAFLGAALLLVGTFLVLLIAGVLGDPDDVPSGGEQASQGGSGDPGRDGASPPATPSVLPPLAADERDMDPPAFVGGSTQGLVEPLRQDVWVLVFVNGRDEASRRSVSAADEIHRRIRDTGVRLALVAPRSFFADLGESERLARLRALGGTSDLTVVLDPPVGPPYGGGLRTHFRIPAKIGIAALLLADGEQVRRAIPSAEGLALERLTRLAESAVELADE